MPPKHPLEAFRDSHEPPLTQGEAAAMVGITQGMWSRLENGKGYTRPRIAKRISDLTGVALDRLLNFENNESGDDDSATLTGTTVIAKDLP